MLLLASTRKQPVLVLAHTIFAPSSLGKHLKDLSGMSKVHAACASLLPRATQRMAPSNHISKAPQSLEVSVQQWYPKAVLSRSSCNLAYHTIRCWGYSLSAHRARNKVEPENQIEWCFWHCMCKVQSCTTWDRQQGPWTPVLGHRVFTRPLKHLLQTRSRSTRTNK